MKTILRNIVFIGGLAVAMVSASYAGGVLHRGNGAEPATIDPHFASGVWENNIISDMFMGLTTQAKDGKIIPGLASSWKVSKNGKTYTFKIRKGVKWSDGKAITAHDFEFSFKRLLKPKTAAKYAFILYPIKNAEKVNRGEKKLHTLGVKALDNRTLRIKLEKTTPYFLELLAFYTGYAVPKHVVEKHGKNWTKKKNIVVSGAFTLDKWMPQSALSVVKNNKFFDAKNVKLDKVVYYPIEDANVEYKRYRAGELHITQAIPSGQFKTLKRKFGKQVRIAPYLGIYYYPINTQKIKDARIRRAMSLAINRDFITNKVLGEGQIPAYSFVPQGINNYDSKSSAPRLDYAKRSYADKLKEAKRLMQKAGYSKSNPFKFTLSYNTNEAHKKVAIAIVSMWKQIGVQAKLYNSEAKVHYDKMKKADFEVARAGWIGDYNDPATFTDLFLDNSYNYGRYMDKKVLAYAKKASKTKNLKKRAEILKKLEARAIQAHSVIPIYYYVSRHLVSPKVRGWEDNILDKHLSRWLSVE